jgi:tRNA(fMet)-specific endonuclease VapC
MQMSGKSYLLDTNIIIALFADEASVKKQIEKAQKVFVPVIAIGELFYGAELSGKKSENLKRVEQFSSASPLLYATMETSKVYAHIKSQLKKSGNPIPENDIWIAAIAIENNMTLSSRDKHFSFVKGLEVVSW